MYQTKDIEVDILQDKLRQLESNSKQTIEKTRQEADERVSKTILKLLATVI